MRGLSILDVAADVVQKHYALQTDLQLRPLPGRRHVFLVTSKDTRYVLKCVPVPSVAAERIEFTHRLVRFLEQRNFTTYSLIASVSGCTWVSEHGLVWEMHTYIDGEPLETIAASPSAVGELLGRYHNAVHYLIQDGTLEVPVNKNDWYHSVDPIALLRVFRSFVADNTLAALIDSLLDKSMLWMDSLAEPQAIIPIHGDVSASNVIITPVRAYLIDFECAQWEDSLVDLAQAVARLVSAGNPDPETKKRAVGLLISSYLNSSGLSKPSHDRLVAAASLHLALDWACEQLRRHTAGCVVHDEPHADISRALESLESCLV